MATQRQILANRANATRSTGPITPEGKKVASRNSTRHGMLAQTVVLDGESKSRFEELLNEFMALLQPRSAAETAIVETMTIARWKQMRIWGIEKAGFQLEMSRESSAAGANATRGYLTFKRLADNSRVLDLQHRYETGYERQFSRAYAFLLKIRAKHETQPSDTQFNDPPFLPMPLVCSTTTWESPAEAAAEVNSDVAKVDDADANNAAEAEQPEANSTAIELNEDLNREHHAGIHGNEVEPSKVGHELPDQPALIPVKAPKTKDPGRSKSVLRIGPNSPGSKTQPVNQKIEPRPSTDKTADRDGKPRDSPRAVVRTSRVLPLFALENEPPTPIPRATCRAVERCKHKAGSA
jgi:hypothetical protein